MEKDLQSYGNMNLEFLLIKNQYTMYYTFSFKYLFDVYNICYDSIKQNTQKAYYY